MHDLLAQITREVALALSDPGIRSRVYEGLHASPYSENKVHFRTLLQREPSLLAAMGAVRRRNEAAVLASLDSLIDLEFYMPVEDHWQAWGGGPDLLIASALRDHELPRAFNLAGSPVTIASAEEPPATPTLAIVPVETDFSKVPTAPRAPGSHVTGVYMTHAWVPDDHEGFLMGNPEFEVHVFRRDGSGTYTDITCSGADQTGDFQYDHNDQTWNGNALLISEGALGDTKVEYWMWEDDSGPCTASDGRPPKTTAEFWSYVDDFIAIGQSIYTVIDSGPTFKRVVNVGRELADAINFLDDANTDDSVGVMEGPVGGCWESEGPVKFDIRKTQGGPVQGQAYVNYTFGKRSPICPLAVSIAGPTDVSTYYTPPAPEPFYVAGVTGGTGSISYEWRDNGVVKTTASSYYMEPVTLGTHTIEVRVWRGSETATSSMTVNVHDQCTAGCGGGELAPRRVPGR